MFDLVLLYNADMYIGRINSEGSRSASLRRRMNAGLFRAKARERRRD